MRAIRVIRTGTVTLFFESILGICPETRPQNDIISVSTDQTYAEYDDYSQYIDDEKPDDNYTLYFVYAV